MKNMTRFSTEEDKLSITRTRSDRMKHVGVGARKVKHSGKFARKTCEQPIRENKDHPAFKQTENLNLNTVKVNEAIKDTVEINVTEDMMEVVIIGKKEDNIDIKHEATVHEPETLTRTNSFILSVTNLKEEMEDHNDEKDISEENFNVGIQQQVERI